MKVYGYLRVSGKGQLDGDGFPRQRIAIEKHCAAKGWVITEWFEERAVSGETSIEDRPAWLRILAVAQPGDVVIIEALHRLARELMVQEQILANALTLDIAVESTADPDLGSTEPTRVLIRQIIGAVAQWDKAQIVQKLRVARERAKLRTGKCEGAKSYGQKPGEAEILGRILALNRDGYGISRIAEILNADGIRRRKGGLWTRQYVYNLLAGRRLSRLLPPEGVHGEG